MRSPLICVDRDASAHEALQLSRQRSVRHLPVREQDQIVGIVCACDLDGAAPRARVAELMRESIATLSSSTPALHAARLMRRAGIGSVLVTERGDVRGIVTRRDLLAEDRACRHDIERCYCERCGMARHVPDRDDGAPRLCADCRE